MVRRDGCLMSRRRGASLAAPTGSPVAAPSLQRVRGCGRDRLGRRGWGWRRHLDGAPDAELTAFFTRDLVEAELRVPWDRQHLRGEIFGACEVVEEWAEADAAVFRVRAHRETIARLGNG